MVKSSIILKFQAGFTTLDNLYAEVEVNIVWDIVRGNITVSTTIYLVIK
jgi:hypothetical protein